MSKIDILIVEDNQNDLDNLSNDLENMGYNICATADSAKEGLSLFYSKEPDLVILDIQLKGEMTGIDIAKRIYNDELCKKPILFITADNSSNTFEDAKLTQPIAYLLKPYNKFTLQHQIELAIHYSNPVDKSPSTSLKKGIFENDFIYIKKNKRIIKVLFHDILYAEVESNYSTIVASNEKFTLMTSLSELQKRLPINKFIRIHKNYLVNLDEINEFNFEEYTVSIGNFHLPIGKKFRTKITDQLNYLK